MRLFKKNRNTLVGVDITANSVNMVEIVRQHGLFHLKSYGIEPRIQGQQFSSDNSDSADIETTAEAVSRLLITHRFVSRKAATALPKTSVISKIIMLPANLSEREQEAEIRLDADLYIPYPLSEVNLDFELQGLSELAPDTAEVLLVATRSEMVESRVIALDMGGLETKVVDVEPFAIERAFELVSDRLLGQPIKVALVDIGYLQTTLYIAHEGVFIDSREQLFGGVQLIEKIQQYYGVSLEEAIRNRQIFALKDDYSRAVLLPFIENLVEYIIRLLPSAVAGAAMTIDHIVLAGEMASLEGLASMVASKTGYPTTVANPFLDMTIDGRIDIPTLLYDAPQLMGACGLALRSFD